MVFVVPVHVCNILVLCIYMQINKKTGKDRKDEKKNLCIGLGGNIRFF